MAGVSTQGSRRQTTSVGYCLRILLGNGETDQSPFLVAVGGVLEGLYLRLCLFTGLVDPGARR